MTRTVDAATIHEIEQALSHAVTAAILSVGLDAFKRTSMFMSGRKQEN